MLQHSGAYTIDADQLAHQAIMPGAPAYKPIVETFGQLILNPDKTINRQMLGQIVFSNPDALKKLEAITHPVVRQAVNALVSRSKQRVVVIEAIKLLEGELTDWVDTTWVVNASKQSQYKRLVGQRKMSENDAKQRILSQSSQEDKVKQAKVVIENDADVEQTWRQVQAEWEKIRQLLTGAAPTAPEPARPATPPTAQPVAQKPTAPASAAAISIEGMAIKRGMPGNAQQIADFINANSHKDGISRMDVMMAFGQKSYLLLQDSAENIIALLGWTVENLVTRMDEFYLKAGAPVPAAVHTVVVAVEEASQELQSEAAFLFLSKDTPANVTEAFKVNGYAVIETIKEIKIPIWREAVEETMRADGEHTILWKQLRQDRVLQPI
jgi:dephospho-CoA kinase